jgi:hypothetical protein
MAVHYRNRAEILRTIAEETTENEHSKALRKAAEYYDAMADALRLEAQVKTS